MLSLSSRPFLSGLTFSSRATPSLPLVRTSSLRARRQRLLPGQIRFIANPPTRSTVEAVRELAAVAVTKKVDLLDPLEFFAVHFREAPKFYGMITDDWREKKRHWWTAWHAKAFQQSHQELSDILTADSRKRRPDWTAQERELCRQWIRDTGWNLVILGKTLDLLQDGGVVFVLYVSCKWVLGSA